MEILLPLVLASTSRCRIVTETADGVVNANFIEQHSGSVRQKQNSRKKPLRKASPRHPIHQGGGGQSLNLQLVPSRNTLEEQLAWQVNLHRLLE